MANSGYSNGDLVRVKANVPSFGGMTGRITNISENGDKAKVSVDFLNTKTSNTFLLREIERA